MMDNGTQITDMLPVAVEDAPATAYFPWAVPVKVGDYDPTKNYVSDVIGGLLARPTSVELAAPTGSSLSGFIQSGTGAVDSTVQTELRKTVRASQYETFAQACDAAVAADTALIVDADRTLAANLTTTAKLFAYGGIIDTGAFDLAVAAINGPEIPLFDKGGTGTITVGGGTLSWLGWFAPTADGTTDDTNAVKRWVESAPLRETRWTNICTGTVDVPSLLNERTSLLGAGPRATIFVSKDGNDVFRFPGVDSGGLDYVNWVRCGGFGVVGQGDSTGSGYAIHIPSSVSTGRYNLFENIDVTQIGGGCIKDEAGLFSTRWRECSGGESGGHVFDMHGGGPNSVMEQCYARNAPAEKMGFRVYRSQLILRDCNGLDVNSPAGSLWGVFGMSTSNTVINVTGYGTITIPAGPFNISSAMKLEGCNIESFPDIGLVAINGTVYLDEKCIFQTRVDTANCIAIYCTNGIGLGIQGTLPPIGNFSLVGTSTWAQSSPVWVADVTPAFIPPVADATSAYINLRNYGASVTTRLSGIGSVYVGTASSGQPEVFAQARGMSLDMLRVATHTPSSASDSGSAGEITWDDSYIYVCTASNTWKRVAIATWP